MDVTADDGLVITGRFYHTATFGNVQLVDATIYYDIFIAKLDSNGEWQWAVQAGGSHWDKGFGVWGAANGDVYVMGTYRNVATFGPFTCTGSGQSDLWSARLSSTGEWLWVNPAGATTGMEIYDMDIAPAGDRLVCGGSYAMNPTMLDGHLLPTPPNNANEAFVAELDTLGNFLSARGFGSLAGDQVEAVAYLLDGDIIAAGNFGGDMQLDDFDLPNVLNNDLWVGRLGAGLPTSIIPPMQAPTRPRVVMSELGPTLINPKGAIGSLMFTDPLGRELGSTRISGAERQPLIVPAIPGLLCWRMITTDGEHLASGVLSGASFR
jgi:hypothetical protein